MNTHKIVVMALGIILVPACCPTCLAIVLTFDDAITDPVGSIPDGYGGFNWDNFDAIDCVAFAGDTWSGYFNGRVSGAYVALNPRGDQAMVFDDSSFDFIGAHLTAAWRLGLNIDVQGYQDDTLLYSETVVVDYTSPTWFEFNFLNIDKLRFDSYGGTDPGGEGEIDLFQFAMDDFTYVPEPATLLLLGLGTAMVRRRR